MFPVDLVDAEERVEEKLKVQRLNVGFSLAEEMIWFVVSKPLDTFKGSIGRFLTPCIPGRKIRNKAVKYDKLRYKRRNRIEIMIGRLKDWRRVAIRYDRCPKAFFSAVALAATVIFWL